MKFSGRYAIISALPTLIALRAENSRQRISFTFENMGTFESSYFVQGDDTIIFALNSNTARIVEAGGSRTLIGPEHNNLTPHTLESITIL